MHNSRAATEYVPVHSTAANALTFSKAVNQKEFSKLNAQIRIIPFLPQSPIPLKRLAPSRSNIRIGNENDESTEDPTPVYNTAVMLMNTLKAHLLSLHALKQDVPAFADALTLLRVWANQRGYGPGSRMCVRGFEGKGMWWASILELLVHGEEPQFVGLAKPGAKRKPLGKGLSSYQLFKAALDLLGMSFGLSCDAGVGMNDLCSTA